MLWQDAAKAIKKTIFFWVLLFATGAYATIPDIAENIQSELSKRYPGARIEIQNKADLDKISAPVRYLGENPLGVAWFQVEEKRLTVPFSAWVQAPIAKRRIRPGERLDQTLFIVSEVDVARGWAHQAKGLILPVDSKFSEMETRQTILEGQFPILNGVQKIPDVHRGDSLTVRLISGELVLTARGTAEEPTYIDDQIRVMINKTKKTLVGRLKSGRIVEVEL